MKPIDLKSPDAMSDDELAAAARLADALPSAPAHAIGAAEAVFSQRTPVALASREALAELGRSTRRLLAAILRFDSWSGAPVAFGMRSLPSDTRHLLFSAMGRDIDLRITAADELYALSGQVLGPDESGRVELTGGGASSKRVTTVDDLGEFRVEGLVKGTYLMTLCLGQDEIALPPIEVGSHHG